MRNALVPLPGYRSRNDERKVLRAAIRQLERADPRSPSIVCAVGCTTAWRCCT